MNKVSFMQCLIWEFSQNLRHFWYEVKELSPFFVNFVKYFFASIVSIGYIIFMIIRIPIKSITSAFKAKRLSKYSFYNKLIDKTVNDKFHNDSLSRVMFWMMIFSAMLMLYFLIFVPYKNECGMLASITTIIFMILHYITSKKRG